MPQFHKLCFAEMVATVDIDKINPHIEELLATNQPIAKVSFNVIYNYFIVMIEGIFLSLVIVNYLIRYIINNFIF